MTNISITRKFEFDAGHRIPNHNSVCRNIHGHRYVLELSFMGLLIDNKQASDFGMLIDFGVIKQLVNIHLIDVWDHAFLVYKEDTIVLHFLNSMEGHKTVVLDSVPTAENLVCIAFNIVKNMLSKNQPNIKVVHAKLYETPNCWAEYYVDK
jgi:6-pyruvoyltetrahydropterin/6-carboxytetrahydropterin synthase